jgi:hypothetical protein
VAELRREALRWAEGRLLHAADAASERVAQLLNSTDERIVLGAARLVLAAALQVHEHVTLADRLEELERLAARPLGEDANSRWSA